MNFRFEKGRLVESAREVVAQASVRSLRNIEGQAGLYHRIVGPDGAVLFENLVPDPRRVPWDTTDDGKHLIGGVATLNEMPLILRLPGGIHGRLEIYEVADVKWTRSTLDKATQLVGSFSL